MEMTGKIDYLRLSVTDRCNLNCLYCTPLEKTQVLTYNEILQYEETQRLVKAFAVRGIRKLRITGGEPLLRKDITELIKMLKGIKEIEEISMTTNGVYLQNMAHRLKKAGLDRVNVSLDTLKKDRYKFITGTDIFKDVWSGIHEAIEAGLHPVKLNVVVMKGINDDEIQDFVELTFKYPLCVRFIEFFPTNERSRELAGYTIRNADVKERIVNHSGRMERTSSIKGNGPARYYKIKGSKGVIGFISGFSSNFCSECNRVRVDCAGRVSSCLFSGYIYNLRNILKSGSHSELLKYIKDVFDMKAKYNKNTVNSRRIEMSTIGG